jgi:di/tricarboxylate transporter
MTPAIWLLLAIVIVTSILMTATRLRPDLIALLALVVLGLTGIVAPKDLFTGFAGSAVITLLAIFIISEGLQQTGVTQALGRQMLRLSGQGELRAVLVTTLAAAALSLFMNNIAAAGVLLPAVMSLSRQTGIPPSRLLMPLAFGTILGGMATLLTTSNIIVSDALREAGLAPFSLLDFLPVGLPIIAAGTAYLVLIGRRSLPKHYPSGQAARAVRVRAELAAMYGIEKSLFEIKVGSGSDLAGKSLHQGEWGQRLGISVVGVAHRGRLQIAPPREETIHEGDVILAQGEAQPEILAAHNLQLLGEPSVPLQVADEEVVLGEVLVSPHARILGRSLRDLHFRERYGLNVLALSRQGTPSLSGIAQIPLLAGDALLLQGAASLMRFLREEHDFILTIEDPDAVLQPRKARLAAVIGLATLGIAATGWLPIPVITLTGAVLMLLAGCLSMDDAYRAVDWKALFLIAGMWPLGIAISSTGLAGFLGAALSSMSTSGASLLLAGVLIVVATLLKQLIAGQSAVPIILAPIGLAVASAIGADPRGMAMAIALGSSFAFLTPIGHPVNTLVMGSGGYTYRDYLRVGGPLTLVLFPICLLGLHLFWHL